LILDGHESDFLNPTFLGMESLNCKCIASKVISRL